MPDRAAPHQHDEHDRQPLDRLLAWRGTRHHTLGPTGDRLCCSRLENTFGLLGRFHAGSDDPADMLVDPLRLAIFLDGQPLDGSRAACMWYPSHSRRQTTERGLGVTENKFITPNNVVCDVLDLANHTDQTVTIRLEAESGAAEEFVRLNKDTLGAQRLAGGQRLWMLMVMPSTRSAPADRLTCELQLRPGQSTSLLLAVAVGWRRQEPQHNLSEWARRDDPLAYHQRQYQQWYEQNCPALDCPDEAITRLWWYGWYLLRHNASQSLSQSGTQPLTEARWLRDEAALHQGVLGWAQVSSLQMPLQLQQALLVQPQLELAPKAAEAAVRAMALIRQERDPDHDLLLTAAEEPGTVSVADTTAFCAALQATGYLCRLAGREVDAQWHAGLADRCREAILECLWDEWDHAFHSLDAATGEPLRQPRAEGLLPFSYGLVPPEPQYDRALARRPDELADLPGAQDPWHCHLLTEALARAHRERGEAVVPRRWVTDCLRLHARLLCEQQDCRHLLVWQYRMEDGSGWGASDYPVGSLNDLIIRHLCGVTPREDGTLQVDPLVSGWSHFRLWDVPYRGHLVGVIWESRTGPERYEDGPEGLSVWVDGALVAQAPQLEMITVELA